MPGIPAPGADNKASISRMEEAVQEPLALIGFSLRYPQDADTPEGFWKVLEERRNVMTEWSADRIRLEAFYPKNGKQAEKTFVPGAHFLKGHLGAFDAPFFGISPTEAMAMDPQHRILLETTYHALESAGIPMEKVSGSKTGVYSGSMTDDYKHIITKDVDNLPKYTATGVTSNMIANRLSWFYNLLGPSINMDSACSSSLMAFDFACQGLRNRDCDMAVVAGASTVLAAEGVVSLMNMSFLSPQGRCFSFDHRANGYSRGEGFSVVLLKRLSDALRGRDTIRAVVRSTGSNQDGHTSGVTQPSGESQAALIRDTYSKAGLRLDETRFFEAHGTGTPLGDPIEAEAIGTTFRTARSQADPLYIGALKSNIGHLEGGSGLAGVIKAVMVLEKGVIPPNANFEKVNPRIDCDFLNINFPTACIPWPSAGLRRASVASFGFGGSNSHAILDDAYNYLKSRGLEGVHQTRQIPPTREQLHGASAQGVNPSRGNHTGFLLSSLEPGENLPNGTPNGRVRDSRAANGSELPPSGMANDSHHHTSNVGADGNLVSSTREHLLPDRLLVFSASDEDSLQRVVSAYQAYFRNCDSSAMDAAYLENLAYTLSTRRSALLWRSFVVVNSVETLSDLQNRISKPVSAGQSKGIAFVFTGQGAQYRSMGAGLLGHPTFKYWIDRFGEKLKDLGCTWSMADVMDQTDSFADINDPEYSQPLTTGLQIALYELLQTLGVGPSVVLGHSSGEIATAYAAGCLSLDSAAKVSYYRGICSSALKRSLKQAGAMMSVNLPVDEMQDFFTRTGREPQAICVACINSPRNVTISGDEAVVDEVGRDLEARGVRTHKLKTGVAYHSRHHTAQVAAQYAESIACLERGTKRAKRPIMLSSVTGKYVQDPGEVCTPEYWVTNLVSQVQFAGAMRTLSVLMGKKTPTRKLGSPKLDAIRDVVEVGPHSALRRPIMECLQHAGVQANVRYHAVLNRQARASQAALKLAGELYARGYAVDVQKANEIGLSFEHKTNLQALVDLPPYPFNHSRIYWYESPLSRHGRLRCQPKLELLGTPAADWTPLAPRWRKFFDPTETPWIGHHRVNGKAIYPATGMAVMAIEASAQMADPARRIAGYELRDAIFSAPIIVGGEGEKRTEVQLHMWPDGADKNASAWEYRVCSQRNGVWVEHCCGAIRVQYETPGHARVQSDEDLFYRGKYNEALRACTFKVPTETMYENFEANGLNYGPPFRALDDLAWDGAHDAVGTLQCFQWTPKQSQNDRQPHVAHPVTLDAAGQLMWVALTKGAQEVLVNGAAVTRIQHAWIAGSGASYPGTPYLRAACTTSLKGLRGTDASIFALDPEGRLRLRMSHVETTAVGGDETSTFAAPRRICFEMSYKPDIDLLDAAQLAVFTRPSPNGRPDQSGAEPQSNPETFYHDLELALFCLAMRALAEVEGAPTPTTKPHLTKYLAWLRRQTDRLSQQPRFSLVATTTTTHPLLGLLHDDDNLLCGLEDLLSRLERTNTEGAFLVHIARHLPGILRGEADPLDLMFNTGLAGAHYAGVCAATACCAGLAPYVDALAHKWPGLRVLEVGAGTGAITGYILRAVGEARLGRYDYTDVSAAMFEGARERFGEMGGRMAYKILDVERDPTEQGFEVEGYDLVVAAWVLHATRDLARTVQNVRRLLKPQGKLVLMEITEPEILRNGFAFGTLPGWWLSEEEEREWSPCVSEAQWDRVLRQNGFQGVDVVIRDYESDVCHENSLLIATALDPGPNAGVGSMLTLVLDPDSGPQAKLAAEFAGQMREKTGVGCQLLPIQNALSVAPGSTVVFLAELVKPYLSTLDEPSFGNLQALLAAAGNVIWLTSACEASPASAELQMVRGLARVLNTEKPGRSFVAVSFEDGSLEDNHDLCVNHLCRVVSGTTASQSQGCELEYVQRDGLLMINRVFESSPMNLQVHSRCHPTLQHQPLSQSPPLVLTIPNLGLLDSLRFIADPRYVTPLAPDEIEIAVQAIGINFRDLLTILGKLASSTTTGCECAGTVTRVGSGVTGLAAGDRVCAVVFGCTSTHARCHYQLAVRVPSFLSTAEAAALPVTGVTAHRALVTLARLQKDESILIHSAAGGTGQMALQLAVSLGADVYVTVGTEEKRALMRDVYGLPEHRIFYSRDTSFARDVYRTTNGRGVDVVVNSLAGDALLASWECVAPFGRFVELGKADIEGNAKLPMAMFAKNVTFFAVGVDDLAKHRPGMVQSALREVMDMVKSGRMKVAEPLHVYPLSEMETAFRTMQAGKNTGKTVLTVSPENVVPTWLEPKYSCSLDPEATYLIAGGLGGLGRSAARWMSQRGARKLILLSRSGPKSFAAQALLQELEAAGTCVRTPSCDVSSAEELAAALAECADMGPIKGCLQCTMVLQDSLFETMTYAQWSTSLRSKVQSTWNLHRLLPVNLDFFIMLSSVAGIAGSMGQSNYAVGNTFQDALAAHRHSLNQAATSIDLGWMGDVGIVAENADLTRGKEAAGDLARILEKEFLALLDLYCVPGQQQWTGQPIIGLVTPAQFRARGIKPPEWLVERSLFRGLAQHDDGPSPGEHGGSTSVGALGSRDWAREFLRAAGRAEAEGIVVEALMKKLARATSVTVEDIDRSRPLHVYGVDSLLAVELRNWFAKTFKADVAIFDITGQASVEEVATRAAAQSGLRMNSVEKKEADK